jgi:zinc/manganese transport system substrate-binding protein
MALAAASVLVMAAPASAKTIEAIASFTVLADMVHQVGGDRVHVTSFVGPNGDPHDFEPTPDDAKRLKKADLVVLSGLGLETWFARLTKASGYAGTPVIASAGVQSRKMDEHGERTTDPHAWNSARNGIIYVENIVQALSKADPDGAAIYKDNAEKYEQKLKDLDVYAHQQIVTVAPSDRKVLTTHDALSYFGAAYGVEFLSPLGFSTENEPSAAAVANVIQQIKAQHIHAYFIENSNDPRLVKQIADATGALPGGELYVEALSPSDGPASTYADMFKYNVDRLVAGMKAGQKS